ncbi:MAG TPA: hypothetical protein VK589_15525 [Chryseolinea sp.]|nr:hypothetical protein [Chryseolinea sp.]
MYSHFFREYLPKYLFIILLFFIACDGDENVEPNEPDPIEDWTSCLITRINGAEGYIRFEYNADGLPIKHISRVSNADSVISTIEYNENDNVIKISQPLGYIAYEYGTGNKVVAGSIFSRKKVEENFSKMYDIVYTYNEKGQMDSTIYGENFYRRYEYNDEGYLINRYYSDGSIFEKPSSQVLEFDDQKAPQSSFFSHLVVVGVPIIEIVTLNLPLPGPHNVKKVKLWLAGGGTETREYTFTYNKLGYPLSVAETGAFGGPRNTTLLYSCK